MPLMVACVVGRIRSNYFLGRISSPVRSDAHDHSRPVPHALRRVAS
jgi:hypothetical protein